MASRSYCCWPINLLLSALVLAKTDYLITWLPASYCSNANWLSKFISAGAFWGSISDWFCEWLIASTCASGAQTEYLRSLMLSLCYLPSFAIAEDSSFSSFCCDLRSDKLAAIAAAICSSSVISTPSLSTSSFTGWCCSCGGRTTSGTSTLATFTLNLG